MLIGVHELDPERPGHGPSVSEASPSITCRDLTPFIPTCFFLINEALKKYNDSGYINVFYQFSDHDTLFEP